MGASAGGVFLPGDPPPSTGQVLTSPTISGGTVTGATINGGTVTTTGSTLTAPVFTGVATGTLNVSGATMLLNTLLTTATGATGTDAAAISAALAPAVLVCTGTSGMGIGLPTGPAGLVFVVTNVTTGVLNVYCVGGTFDGTTGTTAVGISITGTRGGMFACTTATGAWIRAMRPT